MFFFFFAIVNFYQSVNSESNFELLQRGSIFFPLFNRYFLILCWRCLVIFVNRTVFTSRFLWFHPQVRDTLPLSPCISLLMLQNSGHRRNQLIKFRQVLLPGHINLLRLFKMAERYTAFSVNDYFWTCFGFHDSDSFVSTYK